MMDSSLCCTMKTEQAVAPTLQQFTEACVTEFAFLTKSHGFRVVPTTKEEYQNPFEVHFERDGWRIIVEGLSYGFALDLKIRAPDGRRGWVGSLAPKETMEKIRDEFPRGQLGDIGCAAQLMRDYGTHLLRGDWAPFESIIRAQEERAARLRAAWEKQKADTKLESAIKAAKEAFRAGKHKIVIEELSPFVAILPPAEKKRLEISKRKIRFR